MPVNISDPTRPAAGEVGPADRDAALGEHETH